MDNMLVRLQPMAGCQVCQACQECQACRACLLPSGHTLECQEPQECLQCQECQEWHLACLIQVRMERCRGQDHLQAGKDLQDFRLHTDVTQLGAFACVVEFWSFGLISFKLQ